MTVKRSALALAAATGVIAHAGPSLAQADIKQVVLDDMIATVIIERSADGKVSVSGLRGDAMTLTSDQRGDTLRIAGPEELDDEAFWDAYMDRKGGVRIGNFRLGGNSRSITVQNGRDERFEALLEDYPTLTIRLPEGTDFRFEDSALFMNGDTALGRVEADGNVYLLTVLGDADSADLKLQGPGDLTVGDIAGLADIALSGSGDIAFGRAGSAVLNLRGSGDIKGGDIAGDAALVLQGSGDIEAGRIGGAAELSLRGSGDIDVNEVAGALEAQLMGSGDIEIDEVSGPVEASLRGSGDIKIDSGRAERFQATLAGSGDIDFGGIAVNPELTTRGSGDIDVDRFEGRVQTSGDGIRVAGKRYGEDD